MTELYFSCYTIKCTHVYVSVGAYSKDLSWLRKRYLFPDKMLISILSLGACIPTKFIWHGKASSIRFLDRQIFSQVSRWASNLLLES